MGGSVSACVLTVSERGTSADTRSSRKVQPVGTIRTRIALVPYASSFRSWPAARSRMIRQLLWPLALVPAPEAEVAAARRQVRARPGTIMIVRLRCRRCGSAGATGYVSLVFIGTPY